VIHKAEQLQEIEKNGLIAFPFVPHNGTVFKVYVLGDFVVMRAAKSLVITSDAAMTFDSQKPLPSGLANTDFDEEQARKPSDAELFEISEFLRRETGIELLGFDLLRRENDGRLVLVDLNYFPCFRNVDDIAGKFARFIKDKVNKRT
jgi:hypothetical protein